MFDYKSYRNDVKAWTVEVSVRYADGYKTLTQDVTAPEAVAQLLAEELSDRIEQEHGKAEMGNHYLNVLPAK